MEKDSLEGDSFIGPPEIFRKWNTLALNLYCDFLSARSNESIKDGYTKNFLEFLVKAGDRKNIVGFPELPLVTGKDILSGDNFNHSKIITSTDMSCMINNYLLRKNKNLANEKFYEEYFPFIEGCRRTAKNILKFPKVRLDWKGNFLKQGVKNYENFVYYLRDKADRKDYETNKLISDSWNR